MQLHANVQEKLHRLSGPLQQTSYECEPHHTAPYRVVSFHTHAKSTLVPRYREQREDWAGEGEVIVTSVLYCVRYLTQYKVTTPFKSPVLISATELDPQSPNMTCVLQSVNVIKI